MIVQTEHTAIDMDGVDNSAEQVDTSTEEVVKIRKAKLEEALDVSVDRQKIIRVRDWE